MRQCDLWGQGVEIRREQPAIFVLRVFSGGCSIAQDHNFIVAAVFRDAALELYVYISAVCILPVIITVRIPLRLFVFSRRLRPQWPKTGAPGAFLAIQKRVHLKTIAAESVFGHI